MEAQRKEKTVGWRGKKFGFPAESETNMEDRVLPVAQLSWGFLSSAQLLSLVSAMVLHLH